MLTVRRTPLDEWTAGLLGASRLTRPALERYQLDRLNHVVAWARERSPFYRRLYAGVSPAPLASLDAVAELPFVSQTDMRAHGLDMLSVSQGDVARVVTLPTSGTSGAPKRVWFTDADLELTVAFFHHGMKDVVSAGQRLLVLMPGEQPGTVGALLRIAMERLGVETIVYGFVDRAEPVCRVIQEREVDCLVGLPGQVLALARSEPGRHIGPGRVHSVLLSGDHASVVLRQGIQAAWGCAVFDHYGSTEIGLGGAVQCRALAGMHIREADLLFEVVDPRSGLVLPDGDEGELVVTTLSREGMPFIRYRTGDIASIDPDICSCGSTALSGPGARAGSRHRRCGRCGRLWYG
jgi:phenylacetate-CoA ligase